MRLHRSARWAGPGGLRAGTDRKDLAEHLQRETYPKELLDLGIREYREIFFKPYRIIYRMMGNNVYVLLIADGRRDMQTLLQRRLLRV